MYFSVFFKLKLFNFKISPNSNNFFFNNFAVDVFSFGKSFYKICKTPTIKQLNERSTPVQQVAMPSHSTSPHQQVAAQALSTSSHQQVAAQTPSTLFHQQVAAQTQSTLSHQQVAAQTSSTLSHQQVAAQIQSTLSHQQVAAQTQSTLSHQQVAAQTQSTLSHHQEAAQIKSSLSHHQAVAQAQRTSTHQQVAAQTQSNLFHHQMAAAAPQSERPDIKSDSLVLPLNGDDDNDMDEFNLLVNDSQSSQLEEAKNWNLPQDEQKSSKFVTDVEICLLEKSEPSLSSVKQEIVLENHDVLRSFDGCSPQSRHDSAESGKRKAESGVTYLSPARTRHGQDMRHSGKITNLFLFVRD